MKKSIYVTGRIILKIDKMIKIKEKDKNLFTIDLLNIERSTVPAVTHVDYSARIQTVSKDTNPLKIL